MTTPVISVTFASRGRPVALAATLWQLFDLADRPDDIEAIIAVDPDDQPMSGVRLPPGARVWVAPERFGYTRLHDYLNPLAEMARGEWLFWMNDDMTVETPGWDTIIRNHREAILWPHANHVEHANIAPVWPKKWSDAAGLVTPTTHMDTWLQRVGEQLGRHDRVPVSIIHHRHDVTGDDYFDDDTYHEGREPLGPEGMIGRFPYEQLDGYVARVRQVMV